MNTLFALNLFIHYLILAAIVWSIVKPSKRIWPPPQKRSWQYFFYWGLFYLAIALDTLFIVKDWNQWMIPDALRYFVGGPTALLGAAFSLWAIYTLGITSTYGIKDGFIDAGPYQFTRNPQYLGDNLLLFGLLLLVNSLYFAVFALLTILIFAIMPFPEESWLDTQYGEMYQLYKNRTSRFL